MNFLSINIKLSKVENVNFCYVSDLAFELRKQFIKHNLSDEQLNRARKEYEYEVEDEILEKVYNPDEDDYIIKPKDLRSSFANNTKDIIKTKTETKTKTDSETSVNLQNNSVEPLRGWSKTHGDNNIYTRIKCECKECHEELRKKIALTTHSYSYNRKYLENTEYLDINSNQNMREFYINDKAGNYIEDIDEAINNSLEEIKNCYQYRKVKSFKYKITAECEYKNSTKEEVKTTKIFFNTDYIINTAIYENGDLTQWSNFENKIFEGHGYDFEFLGLRSIQINIEPTKGSNGNYIDLHRDLKNSILSVRNSKYNCLQLAITAWLYPAIDPQSGFLNDATRESKYVNNLIEARQRDEDDFAYIMRKQKLYNIKIWVYPPCGGGKVELLKPVDDFDKARKDVRILGCGRRYYITLCSN